MNKKHKGSCACDKARYETVGHPQFTVVCHYRYCQLRTGSALGTLVCFLEENFKIISGKCGIYKFISESGYNWLNEFCKICEITVTSKLKLKPGHAGVAAFNQHNNSL